MAKVTWALLNLVVMLATCQAAVWSLQRRVVSRPLKEYGLTISSEELFSLAILLPRTKQGRHAIFDTGSHKLVLDQSRWVALSRDTTVPCRSYPGPCDCRNNVCKTYTSFSSFVTSAVVREGVFSLSQSGPSANVTYLAYTPKEPHFHFEEDGIAGFGAGSLSVPRQFKIRRFSFCFSLDPASSESSWLADGPDARFAKGTSPKTVPFEGDGYQLRLASIQVGRVIMPVGKDKTVIFDTGSQATYLDSDYYERFLRLVKSQGSYKFCDEFDEDGTILPTVSLKFWNGAKMFIATDSYYHGCFPANIQVSPVPYVTILGVDWLQNHQFLYDLEMRTVTYNPASCPRSHPGAESAKQSNSTRASNNDR